MFAALIARFSGVNIGDIIKWGAIAACITLIGVVFNAFESKGAAEAALVAAQAENQQYEDTLIEVTNEYAKRDEELQQNLDRAKEYRRRALLAERELGSLVATGDIVAINKRLCNILQAIEGPGAEVGEAYQCNAGAPGDASGKYFRISELSVSNLLTNFERFRSYVDMTQPVEENPDE